MTYSKYKISTILAWILFGILASLATFGLVLSFGSNQYTSQNFSTVVGEVLLGLLPVEFAFLAALVLSRQPRNLVGWLLMMPAIALASNDILYTYFSSISGPPLETNPAFLLVLWFYSWHWLLLIFPVFFIMLFFPTGQLISPRWRWASLYTLGVSAFFFMVITFSVNIAPADIDWSVPNSVGFITDEAFEHYFAMLFGIGLLSTTVLGVISIVVRYRRAGIVEREQIKWLLYACGFFAIVYITSIFANINSQKWGAPSFFYILFPLALLTIPAAIVIAILRYRLWDIDVIIRKTLVYSILSITLALVYFGLVTVLQSQLASLTGEQSPAAVVLSTLAIAALFNPLRRWVQDFIDRRFYRKKYDAEKTLAAFAAVARNETDLEALSVELLRVVQETMQPEKITLWLKPQRRPDSK